jgi:cytochrome c-type biogenesis protein CcmH/NrfG
VADEEELEQEELEEQEPVQKQKASVYTMMLICSFVALVLACVLMYMELQRYDFDFKAEKYRSSRTDWNVATSTFLG